MYYVLVSRSTCRLLIYFADEMKESMVAKVCAQAEELYTDALRGLQRDQLKHLWDRDWIPAVSDRCTPLHCDHLIS